jgi:hypothetical protein
MVNTKCATCITSIVLPCLRVYARSFLLVELLTLPMFLCIHPDLVNTELIIKLESNLKENRMSVNVANAFITMESDFDVYVSYCTGYIAAVLRYNDLMKSNGAFQEFISNAAARPECRKLDLLSFLIKPVQRICKYSLLLKDILHHMDESHEMKHLMQVDNLRSMDFFLPL